MLKKIGIVAILFLCFSWISYITIDILKKEGAMDYFHFFNLNEEIVFALHYTDEVDWNTQKIYTTTENKKIIEALQKEIPKGVSIFFSSSRPIIVLKKRSNWENKEVEELFSSGIYNLSKNGISKYKYGQYTIDYQKNQLIIHNLEKLVADSHWDFSLDEKSSYSKVYKIRDTIYSEDNYCKEKERIKFLKFNSENQYPLISDQSKFSNHIPLNFEDYTFYTKEFYRNRDSIFSNSIFSKIVESGIVHLKKNEKSVFIFDFEPSRSPIQTINEKFQLEENNENASSFSGLFISKEQSATNEKSYIFQDNGIAIYSNDKEYYDQVLTELSIGSILSSNKNEMKRIYHELPKKVFFRSVSNEGKSAYSLSGNKQIITEFDKKYKENQPINNEDKDYFAMNPSHKIIDYFPFNDRGNVVFSTSNGIYGYLGGEEKWHIKTMETPVSLQGNTATNHCVLEYFDSLVVLDQFGNNRFTLPITGQQSFTCFDNLGAFSLAIYEDKSIKFLAEKSGLYKTIKVPETIVQLEINEKLNIAYVLGTEHLYTLHLKSYKLKKQQKILPGYQLFKSDKGVILVNKIGNTLKTIDETCTEQGITYPNLLIHTAIYFANETSILVSSLNRLYLINSRGQLVWSKKIRVNEISAVFKGKNAMNKWTLAVLDAIENKMVLVDANGEDYLQEDFYASKNVKITSFGNSGYSISTFLNNYLIQYSK